MDGGVQNTVGINMNGCGQSALIPGTGEGKFPLGIYKSAEDNSVVLVLDDFDIRGRGAQVSESHGNELSVAGAAIISGLGAEKLAVSNENQAGNKADN